MKNRLLATRLVPLLFGLLVGVSAWAAAQPPVVSSAPPSAKVLAWDRVGAPIQTRGLA